MLLTCVNMAELYLRNIEVQDVQDILQYPVIFYWIQKIHCSENMKTRTDCSINNYR